MFYAKACKAILCGTLAVFAFVAAMPTAEAGPVRVRFTPLFGVPFDNLDWGGVVDIDDGACTDVGTVSNLVGPCANEFSFLSGTLTLKDEVTLATESIALLTPEFPFSSQLLSVQRNGLTPDDFQGATATPFAPVQGTIDAAKVDGEGAWFSLVLLGGNNVQLYWFSRNPGSYFELPSLYAACGKTGDNIVNQFDIRCGTSSNTAIAIFQPVPEPSTYAMLLAGLGAVGFIARRRSRKA